MRKIRIYQDQDFKIQQRYILNEEAGQHVGVVLRMQEGERLTLFSSNNKEYEAVIVSVHKKKVDVEILSEMEANRESPLKIHLIQALPKGDKMEWIIQKAVELGVFCIQPLISKHSVIKLNKERLEKKVHQWQAIAVSACEQCGRNWIPQILEPLFLEDYLKHRKKRVGFVLHPEGGRPLKSYTLETKELEVVIGPEGGFSSDEIQQMLEAGYSCLSLGPRVLRTETASLAVLSVLQALDGDF